MLEQVDLSLALSKRAYRSLIKVQEARLFELEQEVFARKVPVIILFEGWDAAGKGTTIRELTKQLDPRGFKVLATQAARSHEQQKPWLWRFWMEIPRRGQLAIFDRSWYGRVLIERVEGLTPLPNWIRAYEEINDFERNLSDDGTVILKFWLHISKEEQLRRFIRLTQDPDTAWQVTAEDWERHRKYDEYLAAVRDMLTNTNTPYGRWTIVPSTHRHYKNCAVMRSIIHELERVMELEHSVWPAMDAAERSEEQPDVASKSEKRKETKKKRAKKPAKKTKAAAKNVDQQASSDDGQQGEAHHA